MTKVTSIIAACGYLFFISGCISHHSQIKEKELVGFSCNEIYIDTSSNEVNILFKIHASNQGQKDFYFFSNSSLLHRDSVKSNFYLLDTIHNREYQLLLGPGPVLNELYSGKTFNLPVLMIQGITWRNLYKQYHKSNTRKDLSDSSMIIQFLKGSKLIHVSDKEDYETHHINLQYSVRDTIPVILSDSTCVYFTIPGVKGLLDDSVFRKNHDDNR